MELDKDKIYALFSIEYKYGGGSVFIASAGEKIPCVMDPEPSSADIELIWEDTQAITSIEIKLIDSPLLDGSPTAHFDLRGLLFPNLTEFTSDAPIHGLDAIAEVSPLTVCESVIYCEPGEWFVWPNK